MAKEGFTGLSKEMDKTGSYEGKAGSGGKQMFQKQEGLLSSDTGPLASNDHSGRDKDRVEKGHP